MSSSQHPLRLPPQPRAGTPQISIAPASPQDSSSTAQYTPDSADASDVGSPNRIRHRSPAKHGRRRSGEHGDDDEGEEEEEKEGWSSEEEKKRLRDARSGGRRRGSGTTVQSFELYTPDEEKGVVRKLDRRLVLLMAVLYLLSFLDRSNIGNAKIAGLSRDLRLSSSQFEWLITAFYITYILFEWMTLLWHIIPPHIYVSICVFSWGILASLQALTTSFPSLLALRAALGIGEAAFGPGVPFYLSFFFRRDELALRTGIFISAAPLATSFASSLATVITKAAQYSSIAPWRWLFLVEGFPACLVAVAAWRLVPDRPETASFLTRRERKVARLRLRNEKGQDGGEHGGVGHHKLDFREILHTLRDPKCYITAAMFFSCNVAFSSMPVFLPTIINEMGYSPIASQALSAPPYLVSFIVVLLTAYLSDRYRNRYLFVCFHALLAASGYAYCALSGHFHLRSIYRYIGIYPATAGFFSAITIIITWTLNNQESESKKGTGMAILNVIGQCGPLLGTRLYPGTDAPYYVRGMSICAGFMVGVFVLSFVLRLALIRENNRRRREVESDIEMTERRGVEEPLFGQQLERKQPAFMYIL